MQIHSLYLSNLKTLTQFSTNSKVQSPEFHLNRFWVRFLEWNYAKVNPSQAWSLWTSCMLPKHSAGTGTGITSSPKGEPWKIVTDSNKVPRQQWVRMLENGVLCLTVLPLGHTVRSPEPQIAPHSWLYLAQALQQLSWIGVSCLLLSPAGNVCW